jgi:hypothetical protein
MARNDPSIVRSQPEFSVDDKGCGWLKFPSVAAAIAFHAKFARNPNERDYEPAPFDEHYGLGAQTFADYLESRVAKHPLELTVKARASMQEPRKTYDKPVATVTGAVWNIPAVLQNLPLAARSRIRTKLAPIHLHFVTWYGSISDIAPIFPLAARLASAINAYIIAGGVCTLRVTAIAESQDSMFSRHVASSVNVQTSNLGEIATALSPTFHRVTQIPLRQCMQGGYASLPRAANFIPGARELLGPKSALVAAFEKAITDLKID